MAGSCNAVPKMRRQPAIAIIRVKGEIEEGGFAGTGRPQHVTRHGLRRTARHSGAEDVMNGRTFHRIVECRTGAVEVHIVDLAGGEAGIRQRRRSSPHRRRRRSDPAR